MRRSTGLIATLTLAGSLLVAAPAAAAAPTCFGLEATVAGLVGTPGDDVIIGTPGPDIINGGAGHDHICGLGGDDRIIGRSGHDRIDGGPGADRLDGGPGHDEILGGSGDDLILGRRGSDLIDAGAGHDRIHTSVGDDVADGGSGNDRINGHGGDDELRGGPGTDVIHGGGGTDSIDGGSNPFGPGDTCDGESEMNCEAAFVPCVIGAPPAALVQGFYGKHCEVFDSPILASSKVSNRSIRAMAKIIRAMLSDRRDLVVAINAMYTVDGLGHRFGIMGRRDVTTDLPEYADLNDAFPDTDWDTRGRGFGATAPRPLTSGSEENLLCLPWGIIQPWGGFPPFGDPYFGESVFVHELAHAIHLFGLGNPDYGTGGVDPTFDPRLRNAYDLAVIEGLWAGLYAETNHVEYFAVGVTAYFNSAASYNPAIDRAGLRRHDPRLYDLIHEVFRGVRWQPDCVPVWGANSAGGRDGLHPVPGRPDDHVEPRETGVPAEDVTRPLR